MRKITDLQLKILKEEYPYLSFDTDTDIERYFELWKMGKHKEALVLYNTRLRRKFPDENARAELLRCYRLRDPGFKKLLYECILILADKVEKRVFYIISVLTENIDTVKISDAYSVIRFAENLLSVVSADRMKAVAFTEKYARYAVLLGFKSKEMKRTAEIIRMYITDTVESVRSLKKEREARRYAGRKKKQESVFVDFSKIKFSEKDLSRILIPRGVSRTEDSVIAYCLKYWNQVFDPAFERIIVLYSKKYKTKHSEIFSAIKNGREHGWRDEEILNAVLSSVVNGYYYNISGDLYMQRTWRYYKSNLQPAPSPAGEKAAGADNPPQPQAALPPPSKSSEVKTRKAKTVKKVPAESLKPAGAEPSEKPKVPVLRRDRRGKEKGLPDFAGKGRVKNFVPNSVADIIKRVSGKTYTVYKEIFFQEIRSSIREELSACVGKKSGGIFSSNQNEAEDIVYNYLMSHYDDPYQNWGTSRDKKQVDSLGFNMKSIEPIVSRWVEAKLT